MQDKFLSWFDNYRPLLSFIFAQLDLVRRRQGQVLDTMGLAPQETPFRVAFAEPGVRLRAYGDGQAAGPVLLIVPAPIKRAYIWDLSPSASVVQRCLHGGLRVYLIEWQPPGKREQSFGLAEYADRLILDGLNIISAETGQAQVFLTGHSLGGTLAALFAALHPARVKGLVLAGAPLHFGQDVGAIDALAAVAPGGPALIAASGNVPGSWLSGAAFLAAPLTFGWSRWLDWVSSLANLPAMQTYMRVERWTYDEMPLAQQLFKEVVELLYRQDRLMRGTLVVGGRRVGPELIEAPVLSIVDARCRLVPPQAVLPFHQAVGSAETQLLWYQGDTGVALQHLGMLVGRQAHKYLWPEVIRWLHAHWEAR
jgi:polyhydroxyalkanoate synthase